MTVIESEIHTNGPWVFGVSKIPNGQAMEDIQKSTLANPVSISGAPEWPRDGILWFFDALAIVNEQALEESQECL